MRDQDLMKRAQRAAVELERAWYRWHSGQDPHSEPMLTVTSYVGYSLNEPVGEPRVVLGVSAAEAELLANLLEQGAPAPLPAPSQVPTVAAEQSDGHVDAEGRLQEPTAGPTAARSADSPAPKASEATSQPGKALATGQKATGAGASRTPRTPDAGEAAAAPASASGRAGQGQGADRAGADRANGSQGRAIAHPGQAPGAAGGELHARLLPSPAVPSGAGPLTLAASAARLEAETRIRASARSPREPAGAGHPVPDQEASEPAPGTRPEAAAGARTRSSSARGAGTGDQAAEASEDPDLARVWGGPAFRRAPHEDRATLRRLRRGLDAAFGDSVEPAGGRGGLADDGPVTPAAAAGGRRARSARAYQVQRVPRVKRQGAMRGV